MVWVSPAGATDLSNSGAGEQSNWWLRSGLQATSKMLKGNPNFCNDEILKLLSGSNSGEIYVLLTWTVQNRCSFIVVSVLSMMLQGYRLIIPQGSSLPSPARHKGKVGLPSAHSLLKSWSGNDSYHFCSYSIGGIHLVPHVDARQEKGLGNVILSWAPTSQ